MPVLQLVYICKLTYLLKILSVLFKLYTSKPDNDQPHTSPKIKLFILRDVKIYRKYVIMKSVTQYVYLKYVCSIRPTLLVYFVVICLSDCFAS